MELAALTDPSLVLQAVADAMGIREEGATTLDELLWSSLSQRSCLIVLDNCEHLIEPAARVVHEILQRCPQVCVLTTSRIRLGMIAEQLYHLNPLSSDGEDSPAVELFVERTGVDPSSDRAGIAELCQQLIGLRPPERLGRRFQRALGEQALHGVPNIRSVPALSDVDRLLAAIAVEDGDGGGDQYGRSAGGNAAIGCGQDWSSAAVSAGRARCCRA